MIDVKANMRCIGKTNCGQGFGPAFFVRTDKYQILHGQKYSCMAELNLDLCVIVKTFLLPNEYMIIDLFWEGIG